MHYLIAILIASLLGTACSGTDSCLKDVAAENFSVSIRRGCALGNALFTKARYGAMGA